jgi:deoxyribodipyrimidine photo-lyase
MQNSISIFWFRRDLRLADNVGLYNALSQKLPVLPIFIFDTNILHKLEDKKDARVTFIHQTIATIKKVLQKLGSDVKVFYGDPIEIFKTIIATYTIENVYTNHDYEAYGLQRDSTVKALLEKHSIGFTTYKDQVIFEKNDVTKEDGLPYTVFTPYSKKWKAKLTPEDYKTHATEKFFKNLLQLESEEMIGLQEMNFEHSTIEFPTTTLEEELVKKYTTQRDIPSIKGTSRLGIHLRFGTISIRQLVQKAIALNETYLNELIWRDFYHQILFHFPHINQGISFKKQYDAIAWRHAPRDFEKWCNGQTGYPIVDAGMRELNTTGFMHNRVRMIVASFLIKHLLIDWRLGEAYFAQKLLDFDFAANNGGWQWASSSGCDAAPYFRIFNPYLQTKRFDPDLKYIKKWVPEFEEFTYPQPIVDHEFARKRCLEVYKKALNPNGA